MTSGNFSIDAADAASINIGTSTDATHDTSAINIGTSATARTITVGNDASTKVDVNALAIELDSAGTIVTDSVTTTTMTSTGNFSIDAADAASINIGTSTDATHDTSAINIGTSATARTITIGNDASTKVDVNASAIELDSAGTIVLNSTTTTDIDSTGALEINSASTIGIGTDDVDKNINIGTNGDRTVTIGKASSTININGALTVSGATTTVSSTNSVVQDTVIELNNGASGANNKDVGIVMERGSDANVFMGWDESKDRFMFVSTNATTSTDDNVTITAPQSVYASGMLRTAENAGEDLTIELEGAKDASLVMKSAGTGNDALQVTASAGGMDITSAKVMDITTSANNANVNITPNGTGTLALGAAGNTAVTVDAKSFSIDASGDSSNITLATDGNDENLTIAVTGNTDSSLILSSSGTAADALQITSAGGMDITNGGAAGEDLDISSTNASLNLTAGEGVANAIVINASNAAGGIDMDAGTGGITIDTTGTLSIDSAGGASNISHTAGSLVTTANALLGSISTNPTDATNNASLTGLTATGGNGSGAVFTVVVTGNTVTGITVTSPGSGYAVGDVLTVAKSQIAGSKT